MDRPFSCLRVFRPYLHEGDEDCPFSWRHVPNEDRVGNLQGSYRFANADRSIGAFVPVVVDEGVRPQGTVAFTRRLDCLLYRYRLLGRHPCAGHSQLQRVSSGPLFCAASFRFSSYVGDQAVLAPSVILDPRRCAYEG